jgi:flagellin
MVTSITSSIASYSAQRYINAASISAAASIERLSSGNRITQASDDVAALATGTSLQTRISGLRSALSNASQGTSLLQVADGGLSQIVDILQRQKALATQAGSGTLTDANRVLLNQEFQALTDEVNRIAASTNFNGVNLLGGGLGITPDLAATNAAANNYISADPELNVGGTYYASSTPIGIFDIIDGTPSVRIVLVDSSGASLVDGAFAGVNSAVYGQFSNFEFSNVNYGAGASGSATLTATINGTKFTGQADGGGNGFTLSNGSTYINFTAALFGAVDLTNAGTASSSLATITNNASLFTFTRTSSISGVNFEGTALDGVIGSPTEGGIARLRLASNGSVQISDFRYEGNSGAADTSTLSVTINGKIFTATNVADTFESGEEDTLNFVESNGVEVLTISTEGLADEITNIRTDLEDRQSLIDALNIGFSRAGSGLNFAVGETNANAINVRYGSATTASIYGGAQLDVSSAVNAGTASTVLDTAIDTVLSLRAEVGAYQSRFDFASSSIQSSIESQDQARSSLLDTDIAFESTKYAAEQVLIQAGVSVLAQANRLPSGLLRLLDND